jgi:hypothetical protein
MSQRPYKNFYIATTGTLASSGGTEDLAVGQLGFFSGKTWQVTTAPTFQTAKTLVIAQGTPDLSGMPEGAGIPNTSFKVAIDGQNGKVLKWFVKKAQRSQNMIVRLGFDGVDTTKAMTANYGETKQVYLKLSGQPINNFYPDVPAGLKIPLLIQMPCADECADSCSNAVPCDIIADLIIDAVNNYKIVGGQDLKKYVKVTKVTSCTSPSGYATACFAKHTLLVCDAGTPKALAAVQAQYPGKTVTRISIVDGYSTYELVQACADADPADFVIGAGSVVPNCTTCPSGWTLTDLMYMYQWKVADAGTAGALTTATTAAQVVDADATVSRLLYEDGVSTYLVGTATFPMTQPTLAGTSFFSYIGTEQAVCTNPETDTVAWTIDVELGTEAYQDWKITLKNDSCVDCEEDGFAALLAELQAAYEGIGTVTLTSSDCDFCVAEFKLSTLSENVVFPSCSTDVYKWNLPPAFKNQNWIAVENTGVPGTDCTCGVQFESAFYDPKRDACTFEGVPYFSDPLYIEVGNHDPDTLSSPCATDWAVTTVQNIKFPSGYGQLVSDFERKSKYYNNVFYNVDPVVRKYRGYEWNTDFEGYYDEFVIVFENPADEYGINAASRTETFETHFFLPEGNGQAFQTAMTGWLASANINVDLEVL